MHIKNAITSTRMNLNLTNGIIKHDSHVKNGFISNEKSAARAWALGQQITTVYREVMPSMSHCLARNTSAWYVDGSPVL
jgi:hypothetical protein